MLTKRQQKVSNITTLVASGAFGGCACTQTSRKAWTHIKYIILPRQSLLKKFNELLGK